MKKIAGLIVALLLVSAVGPSAFAAGDIAAGRAITPMVEVRYIDETHHKDVRIFISNISNATVDCCVNFYSYDGDKENSNIKVYTGNDSGWRAILDTKENVFSIPAHSSRFVKIDRTSNKEQWKFGYAVIDWTCENKMVNKPLMAVLQTAYQQNGNSNEGMFAVNGGQPF